MSYLILSCVRTCMLIYKKLSFKQTCFKCYKRAHLKIIMTSRIQILNKSLFFSIDFFKFLNYEMYKT